jgi:hypothetical protein
LKESTKTLEVKVEKSLSVIKEGSDEDSESESSEESSLELQS